jgi:DNA anti-recombination protein RmuC
VSADPHQDLPMPVTARLSKLFYERLGEQVAGELVDWFNQVDATYRNDLRELNEPNFARFDAKLEQRLLQLEAKIEQRIAQLEAKFEQRFVQLEAKFEMRFTQLRSELLGEIAKLDAKLERRLGEQTRWLVGIWLTVILAAVAIWLRR